MKEKLHFSINKCLCHNQTSPNTPPSHFIYCPSKEHKLLPIRCNANFHTYYLTLNQHLILPASNPNHFHHLENAEFVIVLSLML